MLEYVRKLRVLRERTFKPDAHRGGWNSAISTLKEKLTIPNGILFDDVVECTYLWGTPIPPITEPWIGVIHNTVSVNNPYCQHFNIGSLFSLQKFQDALRYCKGLYVLSEDLKLQVSFLVATFKFEIPVEVLRLPTDSDCPSWDYSSYKQNKSITSLGWWVRDFTQFLLFNPGIPKYILTSNTIGADATYQRALSYTKNTLDKLSGCRKLVEAKLLNWKTNEEYDNQLAISIGFLSLFDSSANNAVVECIIRACPLLVNPLPAVVEYLGEDYPLYYLTLEEAERKVKDDSLLKEASSFLFNAPIRKELTYSNFMETLVNSRIYKSLVV